MLPSKRFSNWSRFIWSEGPTRIHGKSVQSLSLMNIFAIKKFSPTIFPFVTLKPQIVDPDFISQCLLRIRIRQNKRSDPQPCTANYPHSFWIWKGSIFVVVLLTRRGPQSQVYRSTVNLDSNRFSFKILILHLSFLRYHSISVARDTELAGYPVQSYLVFSFWKLQMPFFLS